MIAGVSILQGEIVSTPPDWLHPEGWRPTDLLSTGVALHFSKYEEISLRSIKLAHLFGMPAVYDTHYLALALQQNCEYWTADTRLWNTVKGRLS